MASGCGRICPSDGLQIVDLSRVVLSAGSEFLALVKKFFHFSISFLNEPSPRFVQRCLEKVHAHRTVDERGSAYPCVAMKYHRASLVKNCFDAPQERVDVVETGLVIPNVVPHVVGLSLSDGPLHFRSFMVHTRVNKRHVFVVVSVDALLSELIEKLRVDRAAIAIRLDG